MTDPRPHLPSRRRRRAALPALLLALLPLPGMVQALDLRFPAPATASGERREALTSYNIPTGPWQAGSIPVTAAEGVFDQTAWKVAAPGMTTLQILAPLREQIAETGFTTVFECETTACGGFDFRYGTDILPEPQMHVDLGDFRFLAARRDSAQGSDWLTLMVSRSADTGFVQLTTIGPAPIGTPDLTVSTKSPFDPSATPTAAPVTETAAPAPLTPLAAALATGQPFALDDLVFPSGQSTLAPDDYASLRDLAAWLAANPAATVELVGHTDASGPADANIALSLARADATRAALVALGADPARLSTRGAGPAEPRADNATPEGRAQNRRVEVILTSTR
ncbi:OmpA family protein [Tabrizicola sp. TH137]|uniref:OmpA family protein n=1 Tax=Tabrizicola sp. TH137 TaxID=2067452 RepID=UPI000C7DEB8A|nr:OmpA family protein [Tabrizicola sp. TH137]PLL12011.1 OmpA family protein [Tabrizicola sp. TH137]